MGNPSCSPGNRQAASSIKLAKSGMDKTWEEADICMFICIHLYKKHLSTSFAFRMTALLGVRKLLLLTPSSRESHVGSRQRRVIPGKMVTLSPPPGHPQSDCHPCGHFRRWPPFAPRPLLSPSPHCYGVRIQSSVRKVQIFPR